MAAATDIVLRALLEALASGSGTAIDIGSGRTAAEIELRCTACSGSFTASIETSPDGTTGWRLVKKLDALNGPEVKYYVLGKLDRWVRVTWVLSAAGSATFEVFGTAHQLYAEVRHLALTKEALERAERREPGKVVRSLIEATGEAEIALGSKNDTPLTAVPVALRGHVASIAQLLIIVGNNQGAGVDELIAKSCDESRKWLKGLRSGGNSLASGTPEMQPRPKRAVRISTSPSRGWKDD